MNKNFNSVSLASPPQNLGPKNLEPRYCQNCKELLTCSKNVQGFPTHCMKPTCRKVKYNQNYHKNKLNPRPCAHCKDPFTPIKNPKTLFCPLAECQLARIRHSRQMQLNRVTKCYHGKNPQARTYTRQDSKIIEEVRYYSRETHDFVAGKLELNGVGDLINSKAFVRWRAARKMAGVHGWKYSSLQNNKIGPPRTYIDPFLGEEKEINPRKDKLLASALADPEIMAGRETFPPYKGLVWQKIKDSRGIKEIQYQNIPAPGAYLNGHT